MFAKKTPFSTEFDGQKISAVIAPIETADLLHATSASNNLDMGSRLTALLPKYVSGIELRDGEGEAVSIEDVARFAYFARLASQLGRALLNTGAPPDPSMPAEPSGG